MLCELFGLCCLATVLPTATPESQGVRRCDGAAVSKAYGHDVSFDNPDSVGQTVEFKLGPFGMAVLNVGIGR